MENIGATSDIFFSWLRNIALTPEKFEHPPNALNLIVASNRFGSIFTAVNQEIKWTTLAAVQKEHSVDKKLPDSTNHPFKTVPIGGPISGLFLSGDELTLAVCAQKSSLPFCHLFDVRSFSDNNSTPIGPFHSMPLSNNPSDVVLDFAFNPVLAEMFAVVTSDGSVTNYEIGYQSPPQLKIHGRVTKQATCCSWSPKGKQLVIGKSDGSLSQLKPDMSEAKAIPAPGIASLVNPKAKSIFWAASTVFAVSYWSSDQVVVVIVCLQKNQPTKYIEFSEPCLRNLEGEAFNACWFCPIPQWNMVIFLSRNSCDVSVFTHSEDRLQWTLWDIEMERATLPVIKKDLTYPLGATVCLSSVIPVEKKNEGLKPPSPVLLMVHTLGCLSPYHVLNLTAGKSAVSPPEPLTATGMRSMLQPLGVVRSPTATATAPAALLPTPTAAPVAPPNVTAPAPSKPLPSMFGAASGTPAAQPFNLSFASTPSRAPFAHSTPVAKQPEKPAAPFNIAPKAAAPPALTAVTAKSAQAAPQPPPAQVAEKPAPVETVTTPPKEAARKDNLSVETLSKAFFSEIDGFCEELAGLKLETTKVLSAQIGEDAELRTLRQKGKDLKGDVEKIRKELETMRTALQDTELVFLDALACGSQLRHVSSTQSACINKMDPITVATIAQARRTAQYLERELIAANSVLDEAYEKYRNKKNDPTRKPTLQDLYRAILAVEKTTAALRSDLDDIRVKIEGIKRLRSLRERGKEDISVLADSLLGTKISDDKKNKTSQANTTLSPAKALELRQYLAQRSPAEVAPSKTQANDSKIISRLSMILEQSRIDAVKEDKLISKPVVRQDHLPRESMGAFLGLRPPVDVSGIQSTPIKGMFTKEKYEPVVEAISPPAGEKSEIDITLGSLTACKPTASDKKVPVDPKPKHGFGADSQPSLFKQALSGASEKNALKALAMPTPGLTQPKADVLQSTFLASSASNPMPSFSFAKTSPSGPAEPKPSLLFGSGTGLKSPDIGGSDKTPEKTPERTGSQLAKDEMVTPIKPVEPKKLTFNFNLGPAEVKTTASSAPSSSAAEEPKQASPGLFSVASTADSKPAQSLFGKPQSGGLFGFGAAASDKKTTFSFGAANTGSIPPPSFFGASGDEPAATTKPAVIAQKEEKPVEPLKASTAQSEQTPPNTESLFKLDPSGSAKAPAPSTPSLSNLSAPASSTPAAAEPRKQDPEVETAVSEIGKTPTSAAATSTGSMFGFGAQSASTTATFSFGTKPAQPTSVAASSPATSTAPATSSATSTASVSSAFALPSQPTFGFTSAPQKTVTSSPQTSIFGTATSTVVTPSSSAATGTSSSFPSSVTSAPATAPATTVSAPVAASQSPSPVTSTPSAFGVASSTAAPAFGSSPSPFGATPTSSAPSFGQTTTQPAASKSLFGQQSTPTFGSTTAPSFGSQATPTFGFGAAPPAFGSQTTSPPAFGSQATSPPAFGSQSTTQTFGFGQEKPAEPAASSSTGNTSIFATTQPAFGTTPAFGAQAQGTTGLFGSTQPAGGGLFGKSSNSGGLFGQKSSFGSPAGGATSLFGGTAGSGSFMGGLGSPASGNASSNVFASSTYGQKPQSDLFGTGGATAFAAPSTFGSPQQPAATPAFGTPNQNAAAPAFGSFQQTASQPAFGGPATFGSSPSSAFGAAPTFGSAPAFGSNLAFGSTASSPSAFAAASNAPTFGSLAQQTQPTFGGQSQQPTFAAAQSPTAFGSPQGSAFTQHRG